MAEFKAISSFPNFLNFIKTSKTRPGSRSIWTKKQEKTLFFKKNDFFATFWSTASEIWQKHCDFRSLCRFSGISRSGEFEPIGSFESGGVAYFFPIQETIFLWKKQNYCSDGLRVFCCCKVKDPKLTFLASNFFSQKWKIRKSKKSTKN